MFSVKDRPEGHAFNWRGKHVFKDFLANQSRVFVKKYNVLCYTCTFHYIIPCYLIVVSAFIQRV